MLRLTFFFLSLFISFSVHGQNDQKIVVRGVVRSSAPVEAADCFLKNHEYIGTLTDSSGYFSISFPRNILSDTLFILAMGFERMEVPLVSFGAGQDTLHFNLQPQPIVLDEIVIEAKGTDLKDLVLKAVARIPDNYPNRNHQLTGLYRKVSTDGQAYTHLEEASVVVDDTGYQHPLNSVMIRSDHFRQTREWGDADSAYIIQSAKVHQAISKHINTPLNPLIRLYNANLLRHYRRMGTHFNYKTLLKYIHQYYKFELMDISIVGADTIYQIAFAEILKPPPPKHLSGRTYLKINATDLAIIEAQVTRGPGNVMSQRMVRFEKTNGRYYPVLIRTTDPRFINGNFSDGEYDIYSFSFDDVRTGKVQKVKVTETIDPSDPHSHKRQGSDPAFWDTTHLLRKYPLDPAVKNDLEKREPLSEQFRATQ